ncbi:MAG: NAD(P)H-hydrate dehydratase [Proteobacteria bacterium]|nr:NAD(P)H-hydrate dehydratase [Pseudomonadota bacterium]
MRALDRYTIETLHVPGELLMESAGRAVTQAVLDWLPPGDAEVCVVCGVGNNGGDGLVVARHLHRLGVPVRIVLLGAPARLRGDALANWRRAEAAGVPVEGARWRPPRRGIVVDAIFGTGLAREVAGAAATAIRRIAKARTPECRVIAVDLPSGLDADTGQVLGAAVNADCTVAIALPKRGLTLEPGRGLAGEIRVARIGIADSAPGVDPRADGELWSSAEAGARLPARPADGHKGRFGHVLVLAGSEGKTGAAALAATGAARAGAGLVTVACPAGLNDILEVKCTEAMTVPVADTPERALAASCEDAVLALAAERDVVGVGPGVGRSSETVALLRALAKRLECPLVIDADGLHAFAAEPAMLRARSAPTVLTPHPGEAARLLGTDAAAVNRDRIGAARALADATGAVTLLKGAATIVVEPGGRTIVNPTGGPTLSTGGTGDVLTGMVCAFLGQGLGPGDAAAVAAYVHGAAADRLAASRGRAGVLAGEIADEVPAAAEALRRRAEAGAGGGAGHGLGLALPFPGA